MRWRMVLEVVGADGTRQVREVGVGGRPPTGDTAASLGLGLEEGKAILAAVRRHLVTAQADEHCRSRRRCDRCGAQRPLKDLRPRRLTSLFGVVEVRAAVGAAAPKRWIVAPFSRCATVDRGCGLPTRAARRG